VLAGAGSRKTSTLIQRFLHLWDKEGVWPFDILTLVFNRRAVQDVRKRLAEALRRDPTVAGRLTAQAIDVGRLPIMTFHAFAWRVIRSHVSGDQPPRIVTADWAQRLVKKARDAVFGSREATLLTLRELSVQIGATRARGESPDNLAASAPNSPGLAQVVEVMREYEALLHQEHAYDFAGLIPEAVRLLETEAALLRRLHDQHPYLMVDEGQDLTRMQLRLATLLAGMARNCLIVSSPAQGIYEWAGANWDLVNEALIDAWPETRRVVLDVAWRCTPTILRVASAPLDQSRYPDLAARPARQEAIPVTVRQLVDARDEPREVVRWIEATKRRHGLGYGDLAVLSRTGRQLEPIALALDTAGVPVDLGGRHALLSHEECRVALSYLSLAAKGDEANPRHVAATVNTPPRGIGPVAVHHLKAGAETLSLPGLRAANRDNLHPGAQEGLDRYLACVDALRDCQAQGMPPAELLETALRLSGYYAHLAALETDVEAQLNLEALKEQAKEHGALVDFLAAIDKRLLSQGLAAPGEGVTLATISATKGLEFPAVLIVGAERGLLPHAMAITDQQLEAERRLWYVACTRAKDHLAVLGCRRRDGRDVAPSPFLPPPADDVAWCVEGVYA
jgi:DNA helicase-2/ATP-dependent DNA helicase PcrA